MGEGRVGVMTADEASAEMKKHPSEGARDRARALRRAMTEAENCVWRMLRARQMDQFRFRRQVPIGRYITDFACHEARLIVEIDGGQHDPSSPRETERSRFLQNEGYRVLRFWNNDILANPDGVYETIAGELGPNTPTQTLPHRGGGL